MCGVRRGSVRMFDPILGVSEGPLGKCLNEFRNHLPSLSPHLVARQLLLIPSTSQNSSMKTLGDFRKPSLYHLSLLSLTHQGDHAKKKDLAKQKRKKKSYYVNLSQERAERGKRCWEAEGINTRPTNEERAWARMTRKPSYLELSMGLSGPNDFLQSKETN